MYMPQLKCNNFMELLKGIVGNDYHMRQFDNQGLYIYIYTKQMINEMKDELTSGVKRTAAEGSGHTGLWFPVIGLDDDLVALHQPLTDKLLKHLRCTHHRSFILPPETQTEALKIIKT